jgi:hypothetical protein
VPLLLRFAWRVEHVALLKFSAPFLPVPGAELWVNLGDGAYLEIDQAASLWLASMLSLNLVPIIAFDSWFCPSSRRHEFCAVWIILNTMMVASSPSTRPNTTRPPPAWLRTAKRYLLALGCTRHPGALTRGLSAAFRA